MTTDNRGGLRERLQVGRGGEPGENQGGGEGTDAFSVRWETGGSRNRFTFASLWFGFKNPSDCAVPKPQQTQSLLGSGRPLCWDRRVRPVVRVLVEQRTLPVKN
jgi:hypothetical protein